MKVKRIIAILLAALMVISLSACKKTDDSADPPQQGNTDPLDQTGDHSWKGEYTYVETVPGSHLSFGLKSDPKTFGPWDSGGGGRTMFNMAVYEPLAYMLPSGELSYCIMKDYARVADNVYQVEIYDYVHDSDGNPITASDVVFSFETCKELGTKAAYTAVLDSVTEVGEYTVEIKLTQERPDSFSGLAENVMIVSQKAYEDSGDGMATRGVGTGGYILEDYVTGAYMTFLANENYWQTDPDLIAFMSLHNVERYTMHFITDNSQHAIALEANEIDGSNSISASDYANFVESDGITPKEGYDYIETRRIGMGALIFNCSEDSVCGDENLRKAIASIIDRASLAYAAYGTSGIYFDGFSQPEFVDYDESYYPQGGYYSYDEDLAKEYLEKSDYAKEPIKLIIQGDQEWIIQAEVIRSYCEAIGINVVVETNEKAQHESLMWTTNADWDMAICLFLAGDYTYSRLAQIIDTSYYTTGLCTLQIFDPTLQELFDTAVDVNAFSVENTAKLLEYISENCYTIPLCDYTQRVFYRTENIETFAGRRDGFDPLPGACIPRQN